MSHTVPCQDNGCPLCHGTGTIEGTGSRSDGMPCGVIVMDGPLPDAPAGTHEERAAERLRGSLRLHTGIDVTDILDVLDQTEWTFRPSPEHPDKNYWCMWCGARTASMLTGEHLPKCKQEGVMIALRTLAPEWPEWRKVHDRRRS